MTHDDTYRPPAPLRRILAVDDEPSILSLVGHALRGEGCDVRTARTVDEALAILATWPADYIISDYSMPHKTGADFFEVVLARYPEMIDEQRFIFLSAFPESIGCRPREYSVPILRKPIHIAELRAIFDSAAENVA